MIDDRRLQEAMPVQPHREAGAEVARFDGMAEGGVCSADGHRAEAAVGVDGGVGAALITMGDRSFRHRASHGRDIARPELVGLAAQHIPEGRSLAVGGETRRVILPGRVVASTCRYAVGDPVHRFDESGDVENRATKVSVADVSANIAQALHRSWFFDVNPIRVSAEGGTVSLAGLVGSPHDSGVAFTIASATVGVTRVNNHLHVVGEDRLDV